MTNNSTPVSAETQAEPAKKGNGLIIGIVIAIILAIAAGGFAFYWFSRPIYKVNSAIAANDYEKAAQYYGKLADADKTIVAAQFVEHCNLVKAKYVDEDAEYDKTIDKLDVFEYALDGNDEYKSIVSSVKELKKSRDAWDEANAAFEAENYTKAGSKFAEVIAEDANYDVAQNMILECKSQMVVGKWYAEADLSKALANQIGIDESKIEFNLCISYTFNEDGTAVLATETDNMREQMDKLMDTVIYETISAYCESYGITVEDMNELFLDAYGVSFNEYVRASMDMDSLLVSLEQHKEYLYVFDGNHLVLTQEDGTECTDVLEYSEDGTLILNAGESDTSYADLGVELPLVFKKEK